MTRLSRLSSRVPMPRSNLQSGFSNQTPSATIERTAMNPAPESGYTVYADSKEELEESLLGDPDGRFGQGAWYWTITALECDPDTPVDGVDPDEGNDWALDVHFVVLILRISEVSV